MKETIVKGGNSIKNFGLKISAGGLLGRLTGIGFNMNLLKSLGSIVTGWGLVIAGTGYAIKKLFDTSPAKNI